MRSYFPIWVIFEAQTSEGIWIVTQNGWVCFVNNKSVETSGSSGHTRHYVKISGTLDSDSFENPDTNLLIAVDDFHKMKSFQKK